jgi:membrane protease YdiL (CAAX protease family)
VRDEGDRTVKMARVSRERVLESCAKTSLGMLVVGLGARAASGAVPVAATGGNWNETLPLLGNGDTSDVALSALAAATAVTLGRIALLQVWEEFAASTDRSNAQVLGVLEGAGDVAQVAVLPALGEEVLFRGALLPAIGGIPGVAVSSVIFGALHVGGGRSAAFGVWATAVGACYGACALNTGSVVAPAAAHALANIASATYWNATRAEKGRALLEEETAKED